MKSMKEEDPEKYAAHFSQFVKAGVSAEGIEKLYLKVHDNIRKNPAHTKKVWASSSSLKC